MVADGRRGILAKCGNLTRLQSLNISCTGPSGSGFRHLAKLKALESLHCGEAEFCGVAELHPGDISHLASGRVSWLDLDGSNLSDEMLAEVAQLTALRILCVSGTPITDAGLKHLAALRTSSADTSTTPA